MRPPRIPAFDYRGRHRYFVTCCAFRRQPAFVEPVVVERLDVQLLRTLDETGFAVSAYVFMPDHLHLLIEGTTGEASFRTAMRLIRQRLTIAMLTRKPLWQDGYFERVLRTDEQTFAVADYIIGNPVRARLVGSAFEYPFSFSIEHGKVFRLGASPS